MQVSKYYGFYAKLLNETPHPAKYLGMNLPYKISSLIAQLRLNSNSIYFDKHLHQFADSDLCDICNKANSLDHFIMQCIPIRTMNTIRDKVKEVSEWRCIVNSDKPNEICQMFNAVSASLRLRIFINEM